MKKIICLFLCSQFLLSFDLYKEIRIEKNELENLSFLQLIGIDIDHIYEDHTFFQFVINDYDIKTQSYCDELKIDADTAMYIGLILSELYINSIKHAFKNQTDKNIFVKLSYNQNKINFIYIDNGMLTINKVIKPKLISKLCKQLNIDYKINTDNGFSFSFNKIYNL